MGYVASIKTICNRWHLKNWSFVIFSVILHCKYKNTFNKLPERVAYTKNHIMHIIAIAIAIIVLIAAVAGLLAIGKQKRLKAKAQECAKEVQVFHEKVQKLSDPSHFFTDEELLQLKREYAPLLDEVSELYDSFLISNEYLDDLGLREFIRQRKFLNHIQSQNNQKYQQQ